VCYNKAILKEYLSPKNTILQKSIADFGIEKFQKVLYTSWHFKMLKECIYGRKIF